MAGSNDADDDAGVGPSVRKTASSSFNKGGSQYQHQHHRREGHDEEEEIGGTVFVKRQAWPEREAMSSKRQGSLHVDRATQSSQQPQQHPQQQHLQQQKPQRDPEIPSRGRVSEEQHLPDRRSQSLGGALNGLVDWRIETDRGRLMERGYRPQQLSRSTSSRDDDGESSVF